MKKFIENENAVRSAYDVTGCSKKQITELAKIFSNTIQKYKVTPSEIDLSDKGGGTYIINIKTSDYDLIFDMNMDVAEQASSNEILANGNLIGKFEIYQG